jgi:hypothetical protein
METTFQEVCQRLGFETKEALVRDSDPEGRSCSVGLFSVVTLFAHQPMAKRARAASDKRPGTTRAIRPSLMLWRWYAGSCGRSQLFLQVAFSDRHSKSPAGVPRAANRRSLLCGLNGQSPAEGTFSEVRIH